MHRTFRRGAHVLLILSMLVLALAACGSDDDDTTATADDVASETDDAPSADRTLKISAIPDQDPTKLKAREDALAGYLATTLGVKVEYVPVPDYAASVALFKTGDLDLVFYGGLTGVQARLQVPNATLLAQRDIDDAFQSVFIASTSSGIKPITDVKGLSAYKGKRFTFGSESSTSGRLMPEYFLDQAGLGESDYSGPPGFSGSHDKTIDLVQAGTFEGGALNLQVWKTRKAAGTVDLTKVVEVFISPTYRDYHWIAGPDTDDRFGKGFTDKLGDALLALDGSDADETTVLKGYGAAKLIATKATNYKEIESIGRKLGLIT